MDIMLRKNGMPSQKTIVPVRESEHGVADGSADEAEGDAPRSPSLSTVGLTRSAP